MSLPIRITLMSSLRQIVPDRKSTRLNSSHGYISYAVFCLKKKNVELSDRHLGQFVLELGFRASSLGERNTWPRDGAGTACAAASHVIPVMVVAVIVRASLF